MTGVPAGPSWTSASPDGRVAVLGDPDSSLWFRLEIHAGDAVTTPVPDTVRLWGPLHWTRDGRLLTVHGLRGLRNGVIGVDADAGTWQSLTPGDASYRLDDEQPGDELPDAELPVVELQGERAALDGGRSRFRLRLEGGRLRPVPETATGGSRDPVTFRLVRWQVPEGRLEGVLALPAPAPPGPLPLVVDLHGGPVNGLQVGDVGFLRRWCAHGFAGFSPGFRADGSLGREPMRQAFGWQGDPRDDGDANDVLAGVAELVRTGIADPDRLYLLGHSYGGYLVNRIVTGPHPFRAAVCWEAVADLRGLDPVSTAMQVRWRGSTPQERPDVWAALSPVDRAHLVRIPVLLVYGHRGGLGEDGHGTAWLAALRAHGVPCAYLAFPDEGHLLTTPAARDRFVDAVVAWFRPS